MADNNEELAKAVVVNALGAELCLGLLKQIMAISCDVYENVEKSVELGHKMVADQPDNVDLQMDKRAIEAATTVAACAAVLHEAKHKLQAVAMDGMTGLGAAPGNPSHN